jgi:CrcB protein
MGDYLAVFVGGGLGAVLRHGVNRASLAYPVADLPYGTLFVNVAGSFLMGALAELFLRSAGLSQEARLFLTTGLLGGFTTFSAFSLDAAMMWQRGAYPLLAAYVLGSVLLSIGALVAGMGIVRTVA